MADTSGRRSMLEGADAAGEVVLAPRPVRGDGWLNRAYYRRTRVVGRPGAVTVTNRRGREHTMATAPSTPALDRLDGIVLGTAGGGLGGVASGLHFVNADEHTRLKLPPSGWGTVELKRLAAVVGVAYDEDYGPTVEKAYSWSHPHLAWDSPGHGVWFLVAGIAVAVLVLLFAVLALVA